MATKEKILLVRKKLFVLFQLRNFNYFDWTNASCNSHAPIKKVWCRLLTLWSLLPSVKAIQF